MEMHYSCNSLTNPNRREPKAQNLRTWKTADTFACISNNKLFSKFRKSTAVLTLNSIIDVMAMSYDRLIQLKLNRIIQILSPAPML